MIQKSERIVRYTMEEIKAKLAAEGDLSDWARVDALTEEELEASIDVEEEGLPIWSSIRTNRPPAKKQLTMRLDADIIFWFKLQGKGYQTKMNAALRAYMDAHRNEQ